ncbi:class I SAM-dependent methyltransferase [Candidatus Cloacimonadota bacterium]
MRKKIDYCQLNRKAWNAAIPQHKKAMDLKWDEMFADPDFIFQKGVELEELNKIGIAGKNVAHLSCNNGVELMSLKRMGADRCTGFDICDAAIEEAVERARRFKIDCEFVRINVLDIQESYYNSYDLVYITVGALVWIPDLAAYFKKASQLLKKGGKLFIYEHHPFSSIFTFDETKDPLTVTDHYFKEGVEEWTDGLDYYGGSEYNSPPTYEFPYTISRLLNSIISNDLQLRFFYEYDKDIAVCFKRLEESGIRLPLSYILIAEKI